MNKLSLTLGLIVIISLSGLYLSGFITGSSIFTLTHKHELIEVIPASSVDQVISDDILFIVKAIRNPVINESSEVMIDINNNLSISDSPICVKKVMVNEELKWSGYYCVNQGSWGYMTIPYTPSKHENYITTIYYDLEGGERFPLQFINEVVPLEQSELISGELRINDELIIDNVTLSPSELINVEASINSHLISNINITRAVLVVTIGGEHWFFETSINEVLPPVYVVKRDEQIIIPPLGSGEYLVKAYLYLNNLGVEEVFVKEFTLIIG